MTINRLSPRNLLSTKKGKSYYKPIRYPKVTPSPFDEFIITRRGDRLDLLANTYYGDPGYWWIIAINNMSSIRRDSYVLKPGLQIIIPQDIQRLVKEYNELNKR